MFGVTIWRVKWLCGGVSPGLNSTSTFLYVPDNTALWEYQAHLTKLSTLIILQCTTFQAAFRCTESILKKKLIPDDIQKGGKAIHRFGFTGQIASLAICPKMLRQPETINAVYEYIKLAPTKNKLRQSVTRSRHVVISPWIQFQSPHRSRDSRVTRWFTKEGVRVNSLLLFSNSLLLKFV